MGADMESEDHFNFCLILAQIFNVEMTIGLVRG